VYDTVKAWDRPVPFRNDFPFQFVRGVIGLICTQIEIEMEITSREKTYLFILSVNIKYKN
jgi:hypothetical protein